MKLTEKISNKLFRFMLWRTAKKLSFSCWLWDIRGLPSCPYHGFHAQSWFTGFCNECKEIPVIPPIEDTCTFCEEEKAILQRASPNRNKEIWSLCWECDKFIDWGLSNSIHLMAGKEIPDFDEWLFEKEQVYPKHTSTTIVLKKKEGSKNEISN